MINALRKVNVLEGEWLDLLYRTLVLPELTKVNLPILRESVIPLIHLHDREYWRTLHTLHRIFLAKFDHRLWYYDDEIFLEYVHKFATVAFPAVSLFETPFDYECPLGNASGSELDMFQKKLYERSKIASRIIKQEQPDTIILSPAICLTAHSERFVEYIVHNRNLFDVYAMHCCFDGGETDTAELTTLLQQSLKALRKPVWVSRWSMPSCAHPIESRAIQTVDWRPMSHIEASAKIKHLFFIIDDITKSKSKWFYTGLGQDVYHPNKPVKHPFWSSCSHYPTKPFVTWTMYDFMGMYDYEGAIKDPILTTLKELSGE